MRKIYKKTYIAEAVCEMRCATSLSDDILLYDFYSAVKSKFPIREQIQNFQFQLGKGDIPPKFPMLPKMRFLTEDRSSLVQVGFGVISLSYMKYPDWEPFHEDITNIFDHYLTIMGNCETVSRIGLRYINKFTLPKPKLSLSDYFTIILGFPPTLNKINGFDLTSVNEIDNERMINVKMASGNKGKEKNPILILDLDCYSMADAVIARKDFGTYVDDTHTALKDVFESLITETMRKDILEGYTSR